MNRRRLADLEGAVVMALAAARLARLASSDRITQPLRDDLAALVGSEVDGVAQGAAFVEELLACPWCVAVWSSAGVIALSATPGGRTLVKLLAVAQLAGRAGVQARQAAVR